MKTQVYLKNIAKREKNGCSSVYLKILSVVFILFTSPLSYAQIGSWTKLTNNAPNENMGIMLLMTDGTVLVHDSVGGGANGVGTGWDKLTPDIHGSYANGTWSTVTSMKHDRLFFASQVLPSGEIFVSGGEYGAGDTAAELYDPIANTWTTIPGMPISGGKPYNVYDGNSEILPNGNVLIGAQAGPDAGYDCVYYIQSNTTVGKLSVAPKAPLDHDEAQWLKLPDSSILFVGIGTTSSCRFRPQTNTWVTDGTLPVSIYDKYGYESGCATMLPNGTAIFFGATEYNAIYTPTGTAAKGTWTAAADFPTISGNKVGMTDAPGAMMVNGHELLAVSPEGTSSNDEFRAPTWFLEYDYTTNTFTQVTNTLPGLSADSVAGLVCNFANFLDLPDGTVLFGNDQDGSLSTEYWVYTPGSVAIPQGKPVINSILPDGCPNYKITGKLFNGISEGATFGDDWQNSSNYPLVRLTNAAGNVYYCKTTDWNRIGAVMTDSLEDTTVFEIPSTLPVGTYSLYVVVNGFASNPTLFTTLQATAVTQSIACHGGTTNVAANITGGLSPYTYSWSKSGGTGATGTGLTAGTYTVTVTDNNGCTSTAKITVTQPATAIVYSVDTVKATSGCNGSAQITAISGGVSPYTYSWSPGGQTTAGISNQCAGTYTCTITDNNGCSHTSDFTIYTTTGVNEINNAASISVFPTPNTGSFTITGVTQGQLIELYNIYGQQLNSVKADNNTMYFTMANQADGIYLIRILNTDGSLVTEKKIVKAQ